MTWTLLERVEPDEGMNRWYFVGVQPGLFDEVVVIRFWGSRESAFQQMALQAFDDVEAARAAAGDLVRAKLGRGYKVVVGRRRRGGGRRWMWRGRSPSPE